MMRKLTNFLVIALSTLLILTLLSCSQQTAEPEPANFSVSELTVTPNKAIIGSPVNVEILIANSGDLGGTYEATLYVDNVVEEKKEVTLDGNSSQKVSFTVNKTIAKFYSVNVGGQVGAFTMTLDRIIIDAAHGGEPNQISNFVGRLQIMGYEVYKKTDIIKNGDLDGSSVLMIIFSLDTEQPYSPSEITLIDKFVRDGGGLLVIGENVWNEQHLSYINQITGNYGIRYNFDHLCDPTNYTGYAGPNETTPIFTQGNSTHSILKGVKEIRCSYSNSLYTSGSVQPIVWGDEDSYTAVANSSNIRLQKPGSNPTFIALSNVGSGRVICVGSATPFSNFAIEDGDNLQLGLNLISFAASQSPKMP